MSRLGQLRYSAAILIGAVVLVGLLEPLVFSGPTPLLARLDATERDAFYRQVAPIAASLLGFLVAAIAILISLDRTRKIVDELHRGEAFALLIVNMLSACGLLLALTLAAIIGSLVDSTGCVLPGVVEVLGWAALAELLLGGFYFGLVTYKVARHS